MMSSMWVTCLSEYFIWHVSGDHKVTIGPKLIANIDPSEEKDNELGDKFL